MRRINLVLTAAALIVALMVAAAMPVYACNGGFRAQCKNIGDIHNEDKSKKR